jgi:glyoxylase-like metal-dependent hydrolase (beta-lactamase superfamily II)
VVWNFDPQHYRTSTESMDQVLDIVRDNGLEVEWVLDTHPHADHLMASAQMKERTGARRHCEDLGGDLPHARRL